MNTFLEQLKEALKSRKLYPEEIAEVLAYYKEMISDRVDNGERMSVVVASYDVNKIANNILPQYIQKRPNESSKEISKNTFNLLRFLLTTPLLIPLGILYLALIVVIISLVASCVAVLASGVIAIIPLVTQLIEQQVTTGFALGTIGAYLVGMSIGTIVILIIIKTAYYGAKWAVKLMSKLAGGKKE